MDYVCTSCGSPMGRDDSTCSNCGRLVVRLPLDEARVSAEASSPATVRRTIELDSLGDASLPEPPPRPAGTVVDRPARLAPPPSPTAEPKPRRRRYGGTFPVFAGVATLAVGIVGFAAALALARTGSTTSPLPQVVFTTPTATAEIGAPALTGAVPALAPPQTAAATTASATTAPATTTHSTPVTRVTPPPVKTTPAATTTEPASKRPPKHTTTVYYTQTFSG